MASTPVTNSPGDESHEFVVVKGNRDGSSVPVKTSVNSAEESKEGDLMKAPEILYQVQYKDFFGNPEGTKVLQEPYKVKKPVYIDGQFPILEVVYSVVVLKTPIYKKERDEIKLGDGEKERFDERQKELIIHSPHIINALRSIVKYYPGQSLIGDTITIKEPLAILVHYHTELQEYFENCDDHEASHHLGVLLKYLEDNLGDKILAEAARYKKPVPVATFEMLWMLFKPGMDVYAEVDEHKAGFVVQSCGERSARLPPSRQPPLPGMGRGAVPFSRSEELPEPGFGKPKALSVIMWNLDFDGIKVGRCQHEVVIQPFQGEREIASLKAIPAEFIDRMKSSSHRRDLEARGEKFYRMLLGKQMDYEGYTIAMGKHAKRYLSGRVIADQSSFYTYADYTDTDEYPAPLLDISDDVSGMSDSGSCTCAKCVGNRGSESKMWSSYENINPSETPDLSVTPDGSISRHRYFLMPRRIMSFELKSKRWQALDVSCFNEPKIKTEAIEHLVLPSEKKELIEALVHKYTASTRDRYGQRNSSTWSADPIPNKGEGQIFLLHGPPGAGKTFTAECVAEYTSRPLLSLTCGDIGTNERTLEENLSKWFRLAEIWGAVMLIDEADVYLQRREVHELTRNGLVSVFLRAMEYYRGILFLTTNRVGHFDPAFFSRIHVYIGYRPLDREGRKRIWLQFFQKLEMERQNEVCVTAGAKRYVLSDDVLSDIEWNGREIRNAFQTAVALAEYEATTKQRKRIMSGGGKEGEIEGQGLEIELRQDHFSKVVEMSENFKKYMVSVDGGDAVNAQVAGDRGDDSLL